jgi:dienelactone hydrolase
MIDPKGAEKITVPFALLASGEDPAEDVKAFESGLNVPHHVETFKDQVHGWMAARADLSDARQKAEYARGYQTVLDFFGKHWK